MRVATRAGAARSSRSTYEARRQPLAAIVKHQLADVRARLHQAVCRRRVAQRERAIDDRRDDARFEQRPDVLGGARRQSRLFPRPIAPAASSRSPSAGAAGSGTRLICALAPPISAICTRRPSTASSIEVARHVLAADHVENHVDAAAAGQIADRGHEIGLAIVDRALGAEPLARRALLRRAGGREDARAERARQLDRRRADAARSAVDERRLAGAAGGRARRRWSTR